MENHYQLEMPLNQQDLISRYIETKWIKQESGIDTTQRKVCRIGAKTWAVSIGSIGRVPFIPIAMAAAEGNNIYGGFLAYGSVTSFSILISGGLWHMAESEFGPQVSEERELDRLSGKSGFGNAIVKLSIVGVGLLTQIPFAYFAWVYNGHKLWAPIAMLVSDSGMPIYSLWLSAEELQMKRRTNEIEQKIHGTKELFIGGLLENQSALLDLAPSKRSQYLQQFQLLNRAENFKGESKDIIKKLFELRPSYPSQSRCCSIVERGTGYGVGAIGVGLTVAQLGLISVIGYHAMEEIWDEPVADYIGASLMTGAYAGLVARNVIGTPVRLWNQAIEYIKGEKKRSLSYELRPKLTATLRVVGVATAALSYGPTIQASRDYLVGDLRSTVEVTASVAVTMFVGYAIIDFVEDIPLILGAKIGDEEEKLLINLDKEVKRFIQFVRKSPLIEWAKFFKTLPEEIFKEWSHKVNLGSLALSQYIEGKSETEQLLLVNTADYDSE